MLNRTSIQCILREDQFTYSIICRSFLRMKNISDKLCRETRNTYFMLNNFFRKWCPLWDNVEKQCRAGQTTNDNMAYTLCMLYT